MRRKSFIGISALLFLLLLIPLAFAARDRELPNITNLLLTATPSPSVTTTPTTLPEGERPPAPTPLSPAHRSRITDPSPTFNWTSINGAVNYRIMLFDHKSPTERTVDIRENSPTNSIVLSVPLQPGRYFWRTRARAQNTWSGWSIRFTLWVDPPLPTNTPPPGGLPDLYVQSARIELQNGNVCDTWGIGVDVRNQGDAAAGPFIVLVDGVELPVAGLGAGQTTYVWKSGAPNPPSILVDSNNEVSESDETNNIYSMLLPIPTLPAHCLWTDTPTPTPTGSITALPDLYVQSAQIELENGDNCDGGLGTGITIHNQGNADASAFKVEIGSAGLGVPDLQAGQTVYLWIPGYSNPTTVVVDTTDTIQESDETNNIYSQMLPIPTPPIECTWTDTLTPTLTVTAFDPTHPPITDPPVLVSPPNLVILTSNIVTFSVNPPDNSQDIEYEIADEFGNVLLTEYRNKFLNLTVELPMDGASRRNFMWRARGSASFNRGPWSDYWGFRVSFDYPTDTPTPSPTFGSSVTPSPTYTPTGSVTAVPDLLVHYVTNGLRPPCLGAPMAVEFGVTNWGDSGVPSFVYSINGTQVPLLTPVPPQATLRVIHQDSNYAIIDTGHIEVELDPSNAIVEANEANNIGTAIPLTLTPPAPCP